MIGQVFGRLTVISQNTTYEKRPELIWNCRCECGTISVVRGYCLRKGYTKSCGCLQRENAKARCNEILSKYRTKHGMLDSPEYKSWNGMWQRCTNPKSVSYAAYKDRKPPEEWRDFSVFLKDVGSRPSMKHTLERIDNDAPYGPGNTVWATPEVQHRNTSANRWFEFNGEKLILADWAKRLGLSKESLRLRLEKWPLERALTEPKNISRDTTKRTNIKQHLESK